MYRNEQAAHGRTAAVDVFVYGTLTDGEQVARVVSAFEFRGEAVPEGLHRIDGAYPTLAPGGEASGRLLRTADIEALDAYEGVDRGLYVWVSVPLANADGEAAVYVGDLSPLNAGAEWPGKGSFAGRVERYVRERGVVVRRVE
ncbi:gamma-glutamylcyclotransferase [Halobacteriales archaeon QS_1_67_19]|nr:MAG: gamma-glutamylcyclotransferase [Halobacteriales archaeon QS_1_67_19]